MNSITNLTPQQFRQAADIQERIFELRLELDQVLNASPQLAVPARSSGRRFSSQGLANIRAAARRRWAREKANGGFAIARRPRRKMSAAGRASIAAQLRARWAAAKRAGRNAL